LIEFVLAIPNNGLHIPIQLADIELSDLLAQTIINREGKIR
jgi:hypothetical protein